MKIFILGLLHSGTTFIGRLLGSHTNASYWEESAVFHKLQRDGLSPDRLFLGGLTIANRYVPSEYPSYGSGNLLHYYLQRGLRIDRCFDPLLSYSGEELLTNALDLLEQESGREHFVEKTPIHVRSADYIRGIFPDCKIIGIVRDPVDNLISIGQVSSGWASTWGRCNRAIVDSCELVIRYEDLLDISAAEGLLEYVFPNEDVSSALDYHRENVHNNRSRIRRDVYTQKQIDRVLDFADRDLARDLGYGG